MSKLSASERLEKFMSDNYGSHDSAQGFIDTASQVLEWYIEECQKQGANREAGWCEEAKSSLESSLNEDESTTEEKEGSLK